LFFKFEESDFEISYTLLLPLKGGDKSDLIPPMVRYPKELPKSQAFVMPT